MMRVTVHIERLVLTGFHAEDRHGIALGLQQELRRVFADREAVSHLRVMGEVPRLQVNGVHLERGSRPERVGESVAQSIGMGIRT